MAVPARMRARPGFVKIDQGIHRGVKHLPVRRRKGADRPVGPDHQTAGTERFHGGPHVRSDVGGGPAAPIGLRDESGELAGDVRNGGEARPRRSRHGFLTQPDPQHGDASNSELKI
jgi:hypothetical protein